MIESKIYIFLFIIIILILILSVLYIFSNFKTKSIRNKTNMQIISPIQNELNKFPFNNQIYGLNNEEIKNYSMADFKEIYPKINLDNGELLFISDLFKSRKLFINENNITKNYIHFLRPFYNQDEYREIIDQNQKIDDNINSSRPDQMNLIDFYTLCDVDKLIEVNQLEKYEQPNNTVSRIKDISVINIQNMSL